MAASGFAFAQAPPPAPASVYNWTGWYVGVNAGASFGNVKTDFNGAPLFFSTTVPVQITAGFGFSDREYPDGFIGGGQIGYNWQFSPIWVVGLEADFQGALEKAADNLAPQNVNFLSNDAECGVSSLAACTAATSYTTQIDRFGTVRGRLGYVWGNGAVMSYLTGGLAYGKVKIGGTNTVSGEGDETATAPRQAGWYRFCCIFGGCYDETGNLYRRHRTDRDACFCG